MPLTPGQVLHGRYTIQSLLGQGGFGAVYAAHDALFNTTIALKENLGGDPRQFAQEAQLLASLQHANLPRVSDYFSEPNGAQYLAMEFIAGQDLDARLQSAGALTEAEALRWLDQILDAVAYLHARGIIHRDIKPANIKITPQGRAVLVDFGIAKVLHVRVHHIVNTFGYSFRSGRVHHIVNTFRRRWNRLNCVCKGTMGSLKL